MTLNRWHFFIFSLLTFILLTDTSFAAGLIMRIQQMKSGNQQQSQGEYQQYEQQNEAQQAPAPLTYQQIVDQRNQAIAQAILNANNPSIATGNQLSGSVEVNQQPLVAGAVAQQQESSSANSSDAQDVVDLSEVWKKLDNSSRVWVLLMDDQAKVLTVSEYIDRYQKEGVKITEPPLHYVQAIDQLASDNPQMLNRPFGELLQILAIVDYDFDNGMNKDDLAKKVLGEAGYEANKKRFTQ